MYVKGGMGGYTLIHNQEKELVSNVRLGKQRRAERRRRWQNTENNAVVKTPGSKGPNRPQTPGSKGPNRPLERNLEGFFKWSTIG